jgi:hypothetical protein
MLPDEVGGLARLRLRCHGDSCFSIYEADDDRVDGAPKDAGRDDAGDLSGQL